MKKLNKLVAVMAAITMLINSGYSQEPYYDDSVSAYDDGSDVSYTSLLIPVGAIAIAAIVIAATDHHHHHHHSSSSHSH